MTNKLFKLLMAHTSASPVRRWSAWTQTGLLLLVLGLQAIARGSHASTVQVTPPSLSAIPLPPPHWLLDAPPAYRAEPEPNQPVPSTSVQAPPTYRYALPHPAPPPQTPPGRALPPPRPAKAPRVCWPTLAPCADDLRLLVHHATIYQVRTQTPACIGTSVAPHRVAVDPATSIPP